MALMPDSLQRLHLFQLVSPALPVGAFSYSEGLEVLVQEGRIGNGAAVESWLRAEMERGAVALEAASLPGLMGALAVWRDPMATGEDRRSASQSVIRRDGWLLAQRDAPEMRAQHRQMGGSLLNLMAELGFPLPALPSERGATALAWPAAWAWALLSLEVPEEAGLEAYLQSWVATQLSAAVRLVPLGPTEAQRIQLRVAATIVERAEALADSDPEDLWNGGVGASMAQLGHSALYSRLFRS
ncbi:MAG: urease accessory protein UreF [Cyanobacteriota bacterium]